MKQTPAWLHINLFVPNGPFFYPLKTWFIANKWINKECLIRGFLTNSCSMLVLMTPQKHQQMFFRSLFCWFWPLIRYLGLTVWQGIFFRYTYQELSTFIILQSKTFSIIGKRGTCCNARDVYINICNGGTVCLLIIS